MSDGHECYKKYSGVGVIEVMGMWTCYFRQMVREDLSDKVTYEQRPEGSERRRYVVIWEDIWVKSH